jgi:hypothetical protein
MRYAILLLLCISSISNAASPDELRACAAKPSDAEKIACLNALVKALDPPNIGSPPPGSPAPNSRVVVYGDLAPAFPRSEVDVFEAPATISLARSDNRSSTDVSAAVIYHRYFGTQQDIGVYTGVGWFRTELGEGRSDVRSFIVGSEYIHGFASRIGGKQFASEWFATYSPSFSHERDIYKRETTDTYAFTAKLGRFYPFDGSDDERNTISLTAAMKSLQVRPESGPDRDALTADLGLILTYGVTDHIVFGASPTFYDYLDRPFGVDEGSDSYGKLWLRWDLDPNESGRFRPYLLLTRQFGDNPGETDWIPNQTSLALGISFDYEFRRKN